MRKKENITGTVFLMIFILLLSVSEAKGQTQEIENSSIMEKTKANLDTLQLTVKGMSCQTGCANGIDSLLEQQEGIKETKTSYESNASEIVYDKNRISEKKIIGLIQKRGFKAKSKKVNN